MPRTSDRMLHGRDSLPPVWLAAITLTAAMALRILPLPQTLAWFNPDWVLLFLIYWLLATPERIGLGAAWLTGFLTDALTARSLGQHALAYVFVAYCCLRLHRRLRFYPPVQQSLAVGLLLFSSQLTVAWTQEFSGSQLGSPSYWFPVLSGIVVWPLVARALHRLRSPSLSA